VVVVIGSGAGGGTLAAQLCQRGIKTVVLEAGPHLTGDDYVNDEWQAFGQMSWGDERTTSGSWRLHHDFPTLPAWTVKAVGERPRIGRGPARGSSPTSSTPAAPTVISTEPTCSTGRLRC